MPESTTPTDPVELFRYGLRLYLDDDIDGWVELCDDDVVFEFPFAPPGMPRRLEGKEAAAEHLRLGIGSTKLHELPKATIHRTAERDTVIAEVHNVGEIKATGAPFDMRYIAVAKVRDGRFTLWRDYFSPLDIADLVDDQTAADWGRGG